HEVDAVHALEVGFARLEQRGVGDDAGVVHHDVEAAVRRHGVRDERVDVAPLRDVDFAGGGHAAGVGDGGGGLLGGARLEVGAHDHRSRLGEPGRGGAADTPPGPG